MSGASSNAGIPSSKFATSNACKYKQTESETVLIGAYSFVNDHLTIIEVKSTNQTIVFKDIFFGEIVIVTATK